MGEPIEDEEDLFRYSAEVAHQAEHIGQKFHEEQQNWGVEYDQHSPDETRATLLKQHVTHAQAVGEDHIEIRQEKD